MPARIVKGLGDFIETQLNVEIFDGEIPRFDVNGNPINPDQFGNVLVSPSNWPVVRVVMDEAGLDRKWTFEDPYSDEGPMRVEVWGTTRDQLENPVTGLIGLIEALLAQASNWPLIALGGPQQNPYYVWQLLLKNWTSVMLDGVRLAGGQLAYYGRMDYLIGVHGAVSTF